MTEETLFHEARQMPASERERFLAKACNGDLTLRQRIEILLEADDNPDSLLELKPLPDVTTDHPLREGPGTVIGPYKLLEQIGEGGMGVVFMAEQTRPVQRRVALKIIKAGMDTRQVVARFEAERQALAMMEHPNIARVLDAGATDTARPYFVMELVRGIPITEFCNQKNLSIRERLELFVTVCQAVQHAHQKGIIHRDIKPTNVLVTLHDGRPVIKVIDFGVAKATGQKLTDKTLFTGFTQMIGTPLYMSPEQAEMSGLDVDTRSDIFSAGVLLYELLTGTTPFDKERLKSASFDELRRIIREEEPPRPSTRLTTLALEAASTVGTQRKSDPRQLSRLFRGELDWIVMKCLEKDRTRRYETASALAGDVERYLHDEPVQACPPSARYRFGKFARRNKAALMTAAVVMVALVLGTVISAWQAVRAHTAEAQTNVSEQHTQAALDFLLSILRNPDPYRDGRTITIAEVLDRSSKELQDKFADDPLIKAKLLQAIGQSYSGLGLFRESIPVYEQARDLVMAALGPEDPIVLARMNDVAGAYFNSGRYTESLPLYEELVKLSTAKIGPERHCTLEWMANLALVYRNTGRPDDAIRLMEKVLKIQTAKLGAEHPDTLRSMEKLAASCAIAGRFDEAIHLFEKSLGIRKAKRIPEDYDSVEAINNLGNVLNEVGRSDEAVPWLDESLKFMRGKFGPDDARTLMVMNTLAICYYQTGRVDNAMKLLEEVLKRSEAKLGPVRSDFGRLDYMNNLANVYSDVGKFDEAIRMRQELLNITKAKLGAENRLTLEKMLDLTDTYLEADRPVEAEPLARECLRSLEKQYPDDWHTFYARTSLGSVLLLQARYTDAEPLLVSGYKGIQDRIAGIRIMERSNLRKALRRLAQLYEATNQPEKAAAWKAKLAEFYKANPTVLKKGIPPAKKADTETDPNPSSPTTGKRGK